MDSSTILTVVKIRVKNIQSEGYNGAYLMSLFGPKKRTIRGPHVH